MEAGFVFLPTVSEPFAKAILVRVGMRSASPQANYERAVTDERKPVERRSREEKGDSCSTFLRGALSRLAGKLRDGNGRATRNDRKRKKGRSLDVLSRSVQKGDHQDRNR